MDGRHPLEGRLAGDRRTLIHSDLLAEVIQSRECAYRPRSAAATASPSPVDP